MLALGSRFDVAIYLVIAQPFGSTLTCGASLTTTRDHDPSRVEGAVLEQDLAEVQNDDSDEGLTQRGSHS